MRLAMSEIEWAELVVGSVTAALESAHESGHDHIVLEVYANDDAFRLVNPTETRFDSDGHKHLARTAARAAARHGFEIEVLHLQAAAIQAGLATQSGDADPIDALGDAGDHLTGDAALRALGLRAADLKQAPRKPATGRTLAARIARWATDPDAEEGRITELARELIDQRLDGALRVVEAMLEPEDFAYVRRAIDFAASAHPVGEGRAAQPAALLISPVLRKGTEGRDPAIPASLREAMAQAARDLEFAALILAPFCVATSTIIRLQPSELRDIAEALANGLEPPVPPAEPADRDVCLLGLAVPDGDLGDVVYDEALARRIGAWNALASEAAGGGIVSPPLTLAHALDLLRRAKLAIPDEPPDEVESDDEDEGAAGDEAMVMAIALHLSSIGTGSALVTGEEGSVAALTITDGVPDASSEMLREVLSAALELGGTLFVVPAPANGAPAQGHAFALMNGAIEQLSAKDAAALFADEAPEDWAAAPAAWQDAPPFEYEPEL